MIKGMNHVGISVANLERSIEFYRNALGMEVVVEKIFKGELYEKILALRGASGKVALLRHDNLQIELFEFLNPRPRAADPDRPVCDHGITHFCIEVADIERVYQHIKGAGTSFHSPPLVFPGAVKAAYGRDPDGNVFELLEMPAPHDTDPQSRGA
jgi:catechol 2,3-dioxygenase-like lactoylglutathione lyase family enzyme